MIILEILISQFVIGFATMALFNFFMNVKFDWYNVFVAIIVAWAWGYFAFAFIALMFLINFIKKLIDKE